jgi:monoamine oxidase
MIVSNLEQWFGYEAKSLKIMYQEHVWEGATIFPTGVLTDCATAFNEPFGRVLFASSDTAVRNRGVLEGAVHAGRDAATAARALLTGQPLERPKLTKRCDDCRCGFSRCFSRFSLVLS